MEEKLLNIQLELKAPKNQKNNFGGYKYRSCEDILEAVKPLLKKEKLIMRITDELINIGERYYVKATVILTDGNKTIENTAYAREEETKKGMDGSQITGASSSYARKYALNGLFLIDDVKDSDATNTGNEPSKEEQKQHFQLVKKSMELAELTNTDYEELKKYYKVTSNADMTIEQLKDCVTKLETKKKKMENMEAKENE